MRTYAWIIALLGTLAFSALAADVDGTWVAQVPGRDGQIRETTLKLKAAGNKLTGTVTTPRGEIEISEGKINGNDISFVISFNEIRILHTGKLSGNEIKFNRKREGGQGSGQEFTAKRVS
jgi:hypothetical protein